MLSEGERRVLREIEDQIVEEDPRLAMVMSSELSDRAYRWARRGHDTVIVLASLSAAVCSAMAQDAAGAGVVAGLFAVLTFYLRRQRFPSRR